MASIDVTNKATYHVTLSEGRAPLLDATATMAIIAEHDGYHGVSTFGWEFMAELLTDEEGLPQAWTESLLDMVFNDLDPAICTDPAEGAPRPTPVTDIVHYMNEQDAWPAEL